MSTPTEYQRSAAFGATKASIKAGLKYEEKVGAFLSHIRPYGFTLRPQAPRNGGYVDFELKGQGRLLLLEVKSQWSFDAYNQLLRYAGSELFTASRVCICKIFHPHVPIPEDYTCLPLPRLLEARPGCLTIIPWSGRK